jgi:hypothetical protein
VCGVEVEHLSFTSSVLGRDASSLHFPVYLLSRNISWYAMEGLVGRSAGPHRGERRKFYFSQALNCDSLVVRYHCFVWPRWLHVIEPEHWICGRECAGKC